MYNHKLYLAFWLVNGLIIYLFGLIFPANVVLGNWKFTALEAAIYSSFWLTFVVWVGWDNIYSRGVKYQTGVITWVYFWIVNALGVWIIARIAYILALGISNLLWAIMIGTVAVIGQKIVWSLVTRRELGRG